MSYSFVLYSSSDEINSRDWNAICEMHDNPFMDLRFIHAVENSLKDPGKYWFAIFRDEAKTPVACACYSLYAVDGAIFAPPSVQSMVQSVRKRFPGFFHFKILLGGLPVSTGGGQIIATPQVDWQQLTPLLDEIACQLAKSERALLISFKEFDPEMTENLSGLTEFGYRCADSVVTYSLESNFASFDDYYQCRSKRTRANMRKVFRKFEDENLQCVHFQGGEGVDQLYTDDVHRLYEAVYKRAQVKFERLPAAFFQELARQCPEQSRFTFLYKEDTVVGFCCALAGTASYDMLYCGIDYELNPQADVYFNLMYRALEDGIAQQVPQIKVGAAADEFKKRMGCSATPLSVYVKAPGVIPSRIFNAISGLLFRKTPPADA